MRVAVIGAGIVGVTTAYELALRGHEVTVYERHGTVAAETSFANAGVVAPGYVTPWAAPGMPRKLLGQLLGRDGAMRLGGLPTLAGWRWLWRWWKACDARTYTARRGELFALARSSQYRLREITANLRLEYEQGRGLLVLLRSEQEVTQARASLKLLAELGVTFHLIDGAGCRRVEPALSEATALKAGIHLPDDEVGNCRQFAVLLRAEAQRRGVEFRFNHLVQGIEPGAPVRIDSIALATDAESTLGAPAPVTTGTPQSQTFDGVVVCAALGAAALLRPLGLRLPLHAVHGYSITLPVRHFETHPDTGPRAALMDERHKVAISRLGDRVRVAGGVEFGGPVARLNPAPIETLYRVLDDWFPSAARRNPAQTWKGARPMLPDGPPRVGASGVPGVWLNLGHGSSGWALACGSAQRIAEQLGRAPTPATGVTRLLAQPPP